MPEDFEEMEYDEEEYWEEEAFLEGMKEADEEVMGRRKRRITESLWPEEEMEEPEDFADVE